MAAILFRTQFFGTRAAVRRLGSDLFSGSSRHEVAAIIGFTRRLLAVAGNTLLVSWAVAALGFWSLILFGLVQ
jgi:hypothetical protein